MRNICEELTFPRQADITRVYWDLDENPVGITKDYSNNGLIIDISSKFN